MVQNEEYETKEPNVVKDIIKKNESKRKKYALIKEIDDDSISAGSISKQTISLKKEKESDLFREDSKKGSNRSKT